MPPTLTATRAVLACRQEHQADQRLAALPQTLCVWGIVEEGWLLVLLEGLECVVILRKGREGCRMLIGPWRD